MQELAHSSIIVLICHEMTVLTNWTVKAKMIKRKEHNQVKTGLNVQ